MGVGHRLAALFGRKSARTAEDPRAVLESAYQRQAELLAQVRRGVADVATSRRRLELQSTRLRSSADKLHTQAQDALGSGDEDLAREALTRRQAVLAQLDDLRAQQEALAKEEDRLNLTAQRLQAKVEAFRTRKEALKANYTAAEAQTRIGEALTGMSDEMGDVGLAIARAEDQTAQMQSRAAAVDELLASGLLDDLTAPGGRRDAAQAALDRHADSISVDAELDRMKRQLPRGD